MKRAPLTLAPLVPDGGHQDSRAEWSHTEKRRELGQGKGVHHLAILHPEVSENRHCTLFQLK